MANDKHEAGGVPELRSGKDQRARFGIRKIQPGIPAASLWAKWLWASLLILQPQAPPRVSFEDYSSNYVSASAV